MNVYYKCYILIELPFRKELMLIKQVHQKSAIFFKCKGFKFQPNVCNKCHDLLVISMNLSDMAISNIENSDYHCAVSGISKNEAVNLMLNTNLR